MAERASRRGVRTHRDGTVTYYSHLDNRWHHRIDASEIPLGELESWPEHDQARVRWFELVEVTGFDLGRLRGAPKPQRRYPSCQEVAAEAWSITLWWDQRAITLPRFEVRERRWGES